MTITEIDTIGLTSLKIIAAIIILALSLFFGLYPLSSGNFHTNPKLLRISNTFAGGIFLSICLIQLVPEAQEHFQAFFKQQNIKLDFPCSFLIILVTYTLILFLEKVSFTAALQEKLFEEKIIEDDEEREKLMHCEHHLDVLETKKPDGDSSQASKITPYILAGTLTLHSIFEGMALGLQSKFTDAFNLSLAIILHKWAESLTLSVNFFISALPFKVSAFLIISFSLSGPLGIFFGWMAAGTSPLLLGIFLSIASGTFLYISASEIVSEEFGGEQKNIYLKFLFFVLGIIIIVSIKCVEHFVFHMV